MDTENLKILRSKIPIALDVAIRLLQKHNGDVIACERDFHNDNIREVSSIAECDIETARENYNFCKYDKTKAIERINSRQVIITSRENPTPGNEIGFILWPENKNGERYKTLKRNDAFIPAADFDYVINEFKSVFPLENPRNKNTEDSFDVCGNNYFDNTTCKIIIERINQTKPDDPRVAKFTEEVIDWFNDKLKYAEYIVVYGNL